MRGSENDSGSPTTTTTLTTTTLKTTPLWIVAPPSWLLSWTTARILTSICLLPSTRRSRSGSLRLSLFLSNTSSSSEFRPLLGHSEIKHNKEEEKVSRRDPFQKALKNTYINATSWGDGNDLHHHHRVNHIIIVLPVTMADMITDGIEGEKAGRRPDPPTPVVGPGVSGRSSSSLRFEI